MAARGNQCFGIDESEIDRPQSLTLPPPHIMVSLIAPTSIGHCVHTDWGSYMGFNFLLLVTIQISVMQMSPQHV